MLFSVAGFFLALLFVPETKALSLEELDQGSFCLSPLSLSECLLITTCPLKQCLACRRTHTRHIRSRRSGTTSVSMSCARKSATCRRCTSTKARLGRRRTRRAGMVPHELTSIFTLIFNYSLTKSVKLYHDHTLRCAGLEALYIYIVCCETTCILPLLSNLSYSQLLP